MPNEKKSSEAIMAGMEWARGRVGGDEVTEEAAESQGFFGHYKDFASSWVRLQAFEGFQAEAW